MFALPKRRRPAMYFRPRQSPESIAFYRREAQAKRARKAAHLAYCAALSAERRAEIAPKGGESVPAAKRSFSTDTALASTAGRKGGRRPKTRRAPAQA